MQKDSMIVKRKHKKKKNKFVETDVRAGLETLELIDNAPVAECPNLPTRDSLSLKFTCSCINGNPAISPDNLVRALGMISDPKEVILLHVHRSNITFMEPIKPKVDISYLRSLLRQEGHIAAAKRFQRQNSTM